MTFQELQPKVIAITSSATSTRDEKLLTICQLLNESIEYYNWVGFYFANHDTKTLHLGPYVGAETDHTVIPFGKGIDSHVIDPFTEADERFLEFVNEEIAKLF